MRSITRVGDTKACRVREEKSPSGEKGWILTYVESEREVQSLEKAAWQAKGTEACWT